MEEKEFTENLINAVRSKEILYNKRHPLYFHPAEKIDCWTVISITVRRTTEECQKKWKSLREKFVKECRKLDKRAENGEQSDWPFFESLMFLKKHTYKRRPNDTSGVIIFTKEPNDATFGDPLYRVSSTSSNPQPNTTKLNMKEGQVNKVMPPKTPANTGHHQSVKPYDSFNIDECFSKTLVSLLKEFPEDKKDEVRIKLFNYVMELKKELTSQEVLYKPNTYFINYNLG